MHSRKRITLLDNRRFGRGQLVKPLANLVFCGELSREPHIRRMVPGLRLKKPTVIITQLRVGHMLAKKSKSLTASGLDEPRDEQSIDSSPRLVSPHKLMKSGAIRAGRQLAEPNPPPVEQVEHHPKMLELLLHDLCHRPREIGVIHVGKKKIHRGTRRLLLTVGMVDEHDLEIGIDLGKPPGAGRRLKAQHVFLVDASKIGCRIAVPMTAGSS